MKLLWTKTIYNIRLAASSTSNFEECDKYNQELKPVFFGCPSVSGNESLEEEMNEYTDMEPEEFRSEE